METEEWLCFYEEIARDFGFSVEKDEESASLLNSLLEKPDLALLEERLSGREVKVFGAGPSLQSHLPGKGDIAIAADGACSYLMEKGVVPGIVVTDLDGRIRDIQEANRRGALVILHAHGGNIGRVRSYAGSFTHLFGTTQTRPFGRLLNFGGFTDGDRAVFLAEHFKPERIVLYGMDFDSEPGRYSFTKKGDVELKMRKLAWAKRLISYLQSHSQVDILFADQGL